MEWELLTLPEHMNASRVFGGVRVVRSLVLCVVDRCLSFCYFSFGHCIVCFDLRLLITLCIFENEINIDETSCKTKDFYFKNEKQIIVLNWLTMKFIDRTGEML